MTLPSEEVDVQKLRAEITSLSSELDSLKKELDETKKSTTQYLQNVAHQLTAPLNAIKWNIEAIKDETVSIGRKKNLLSSIYSQGTILVHLIKNFSLMSNLEADHETLGRKSGRILVFYRGPIELPSDIAGVVWIDISNGIEAAGEQIRREVNSIC